MTKKRLVIAGTGSGVGKTTLTIGIMAALKQKGLTVQGFKCGPDYIDPTYHTAVTGRSSRNLDCWMLSEETMQTIFYSNAKDADIAIVEGVMGLFDGRDASSNKGSTAHISEIIESPILLVVNCASMARSAAAIVKGFQLFSDNVTISGVIANQVGSEGHFQLVKTAIEQQCGVPVIGYLKRELEIEIPERSQGLIPSVERGELQPFFDKLGSLIADTIDLDKLVSIATTSSTIQPPIDEQKKETKRVKIAVAKDLAFHSYYMENFELLEQYGAELCYFSPLANECLPDGVDGLYIGGTLPEEFIPTVTNNDTTKSSIRSAIKSGLPTFAEGGGYMYLTTDIETTDGAVYPMVGIVSGTIQLHKKLAALGYRSVYAASDQFLLQQQEEARGHEFHYATFQGKGVQRAAYRTIGMRGTKEEGYASSNVVAGFTQLHFASNPAVVQNFINRCTSYKKIRRNLNE